MRCIDTSERVGFPDVHLSTAKAEIIVKIGLAIDVPHVRALSIAVASTEGCACIVVALSQVTVLRHFDEVKRAIDTTGKRGSIHVECELLVAEAPP